MDDRQDEDGRGDQVERIGADRSASVCAKPPRRGGSWPAEGEIPRGRGVDRGDDRENHRASSPAQAHLPVERPAVAEDDARRDAPVADASGRRAAGRGIG